MGHQGQNYSYKGYKPRTWNYNRSKPRPRISKSSISDSVDSAISSKGSITDLAEASRSTPSPCKSPQSYMQMSPLLSSCTQNSFQSIYPRVLEVINGEQFLREPTQAHVYSPFNDCNCTDSAVCDYCTSRYQHLKVSHDALTPYRSRSLSTSTGGTLSPPLQSHYPRYASIACNYHPYAQYFFCLTCYITSCTVCELAKHKNHDIGNLEDAFETAEIQARPVYSEMLNNIEAFIKELNELPVISNILEGKARQTTEDVLSFVQLLNPGVAKEEQSRLRKSQNSLLMKIEEIKTSQKSLINKREELLRSSILLLRSSANRLYYAMQASKTAANPLDLIMKKYMAIFDMNRVRESHKDCVPIKNWMAFKVSSNVENVISQLGTITLDNPGPIGDGRPVSRRGHASNSTSPIRNRSLLPVGRGNAVSGYKSPVIIWTEWFRAPRHRIKVIGVTRYASENLCRPWGVACDQFGHIVVGDRSNNRIQIYGEDGSFIRRFGRQGRDLGEFDRPAGIAIDKHRRIIVADKDNHRIQIFTMEGKFLHTFGVMGVNYGEFVYPWDVAVNSECEIVVSDTRNNRIQMFSPQGIFLKSFGNVDDPTILDVPRGVCFTPEGHVLVCDFNNHRVVKVNSDFTSSEIVVREKDRLRPISRPQGIVADDKGNFVVIDSKNNRFQVRNKNGLFRREFGMYENEIFKMASPAGVALTTSGKIIVVDFGHNRILIF